jgi:hypothetical protein
MACITDCALVLVSWSSRAVFCSLDSFDAIDIDIDPDPIPDPMLPIDSAEPPIDSEDESLGFLGSLGSLVLGLPFLGIIFNAASSSLIFFASSSAGPFICSTVKVNQYNCKN